jgi:ribose transport system ATP-binding protein
MTTHVDRLHFEHLSKHFGPSLVLDDATMHIAPGEVRALVGQNGSGKSTLIKLLAGFHAPEKGAKLFIDGDEVALPVRPERVRDLGVAFVHQDLGLVDHLSVSENINIGWEQPSPVLRRLDRRAEERVAARALDVLGVDIDPTIPVMFLSAEARTTVAIARALRAQREGAGLIVLDEPTRALSHDSAQSLYAILRRTAKSGTSVLVVAHSLPEVLAISDKVTVLRDGHVVGDGLVTSQLTEQVLARHVLGRDLDETTIASEPPAPSAHITVRGLVVGAMATIDASISKGEIVGVTGRQGDGWEAIPYLLTGALPAQGGSIRIGSETVDLAKASLGTLLRLGVVLVPERRDIHGLAVGLTVAENITIPRIGRQGRPWFSGLKWQRDEAADVMTRLGVHPPDPAMPVGQLSGGNQQKVLFGKWMLGGPAFLVLHEPTQGVDVAARRDLLKTLVGAAQGGSSILMATSDVNDLSAVCHRVLVVRKGNVVAELVQPDPDEIVDAVFEQMPQIGHTA